MTLGSTGSTLTAPVVSAHWLSVSGDHTPNVDFHTPPDAVAITSGPPAALCATPVTRPASICGPEVKYPLSAPKKPAGPSGRQLPAKLIAPERLRRTEAFSDASMRARIMASYGRTV